MARIAFLYEPSPSLPSLTDFAAKVWMQGLCEAQHQVKVITSPSEIFPEPRHSRIEWAEPMSSWSLLEIPRLLTALLPFRPELVHVIAQQPLRPWKIWPWLGSRTAPLLHCRWVFTSGDQSRSSAPLFSYDASLRPGSTVNFPWPLPALDPQASAESIADFGPPGIFIPGPIEAVEDPEQTLAHLLQVAALHSDWRFYFGWSWQDLPPIMRRRWRRALAHANLENRLQLVGPLAPEALRHWIEYSRLVLLSPLKKDSWPVATLAQLAAHLKERLWMPTSASPPWPIALANLTDLPPAAPSRLTIIDTHDLAINSLTRFYRQLL